MSIQVAADGITVNAIHQVGGIAFSIGDPVDTDCVKYGEDDYSNHPTVNAWSERGRKDGPPVQWPDFEEKWQAFSAFEAGQRATQFERADRWQLVLQIDSDLEVGMQWGDLGRIYVSSGSMTWRSAVSSVAGRSCNATDDLQRSPV